MQFFKLKTVITSALRLAALCAASSSYAQSGVQLYGIVDLGVNSQQLSGDTRTTRVVNGNLTTSYWGLKGSEDLGGGWRTEFAMESFFSADTGALGRSPADPFWARSSWVGVAGPYGTLRFGRQTMPAYIIASRFSPLGGSTGLGPFMMHTYVASAAQPMMTGSGASDAAWSNAVGWSTPQGTPLSAAVVIVPSEAASSGGRVSASAGYASGPFAASVAVEKLSDMALSWGAPVAPLATLAKPLFVAADAKMAIGGASYDFGAAKVFGLLYRSELTDANKNAITLKTWQLGTLIPDGGPGNVVLAYANTDKVQNAFADVNRKTLTVGYDYRLSKRSDVYAMLMRDMVSTLSAGTSLALGLRHSF